MHKRDKSRLVTSVYRKLTAFDDFISNLEKSCRIYDETYKPKYFLHAQ